jgi:hypothetical protein
LEFQVKKIRKINKFVGDLFSIILNIFFQDPQAVGCLAKRGNADCPALTANPGLDPKAIRDRPGGPDSQGHGEKRAKR